MIDTAGTIVNAANEAKENGATSVTAIATHALLSVPAIDRINKSNIGKLVVTDTVSIEDEKKLGNMEIVTVANVFGEAIRRVYEGKSVSALFEF
jgi:ribose-phosphate pyrophosphokinase